MNFVLVTNELLHMRCHRTEKKSDNLSLSRSCNCIREAWHNHTSGRKNSVAMVQKVGMRVREELEAIGSKRGTIRIELKSHHITDFHN